MILFKRLKTEVKKHLPEPNDLIFLAGGAAICYGVWLIYRPAGIIAAGLGLILLSIVTSRPKSGG